MKSGTLVFWLGFFLVLLPFLGIPLAWKFWGVSGIGGLLIVVGYWQRRAAFLESLKKTGGERHGDAFVETTKPLFDKSKLQ